MSSTDVSIARRSGGGRWVVGTPVWPRSKAGRGTGGRTKSGALLRCACVCKCDELCERDTGSRFMPSKSEADFGLTMSALVASDDVDDVLLVSSTLPAPDLPKPTTSVRLFVRRATAGSEPRSPSRPKSDLIWISLDLDLPGLLRRCSVWPGALPVGTPVAGGEGSGVATGVSCSVDRSMIARLFLPPPDLLSTACPSRLCVHELAREIGFLLRVTPVTGLSSVRGTISSSAICEGVRDATGSSFSLSLVVSALDGRGLSRCRPPASGSLCR